MGDYATSFNRLSIGLVRFRWNIHCFVASGIFHHGFRSIAGFVSACGSGILAMIYCGN